MSKIFYKELRNQIVNKELKNCYFIYGDEKYLISKLEKAIIKAVMGEDISPFNLMQINGEEIDLDSFSTYINTYPVASKNKCVVVKNLDINSMNQDTITEFIDIIKDIPEYCTVLIIEVTKSKTSKWTKSINEISNFVCTADISSKNGVSTENQIISWVRSYKKSISPQLCQRIINKCGSDFTNLKNEVDKLCMFEKSEVISADSVDKIVTENLESKIFSVCNFLMDGNYAEMRKQLRILFNNNEDPIIILAAISASYIDMYRVSEALNSGHPARILKDYYDYSGKKEFKLDVAQRNLKKLSRGKVKSSICELAKADEELKSLYLDPQIIISALIARLVLIRES